MVVIAAIGVSAYVSTQRLLEANRWVTHTHQVIEGLEQVLSVLKDAETGQRGFVLTGQQRYLEPYNAATGQVKHDIDALAALTHDNAAQQESLEQVGKLTDAKLAELQKIIQLRSKSGLESALPVILSDRGKKIMDELRRVVAEMQAREQHLLEERNTAADAAANRTIWAVAVWMPIALLLLAVAAVVLMRSVRLGGPAARPSTPGKKWGGIAIRYAAAVAIVAIVVVLRMRLTATFGPLPLFVLFYPAILLVASLAGGGPGILATVLAALATDYWFIPPYGSFTIAATNDVLALGIFTAANLFLCVLAERLRRSRWAEAVSVAQELQLEELSRLNEELSQQSEELSQQNEELSQQSEELAQQNEELQTQSEEIQTLNTELTRREDLMQKLLDAARLSSAERTVMQDICGAAKEMFGAAASVVMVLEPQGSRLAIRAQAGLGPVAANIESLPAAKCFVELVLAENKTAALADAALRPDLSLLRLPGEQPFQAVLAAPMRAAGRPFAVVGIYSRQKQDWTTEQFRLAEWLAAQCARIQETLRLQEELVRLAAIVESSDDAILSKDLNGTIRTWNAGAERLFGYRAEEVIGQPITLLLPPERIHEEQQILDRLLSGQRVEHMETVRVTKDGRPIDVSVTVSPLKDRDGQIFGASKIVRDITERKRAEGALQRIADDLARSNKDLEQFAYVASHDLREPLRMVTGFMSLLKDHCQGKLDAKADEYIGFASDAASRMQGLIDDLLAYSRAGRGEMTERAEIGAVLDGVLRTLTVSIEESGAVITHDCLPTVTFNPVELTQVLQNLIGNALTFRGERKPEIHVGAQRQPGGWLLTVRDNGIGIDPQFSDRIFLIFQRLHTREQYPGTGIGLAICKKVVERHGGRIWVESQPAMGSTFCFTIPDQEKERG
jgi:PAS domain S-box-containing protein